MTENYLNILAETIRNNWDQPALTDFYLTEDDSAQDTSRGNHYTYGEMYVEICRVTNLLTSLGLQKGDHIAICGANSAHWVIAYLAVAKMQGVSVTVMHTLMPDEITRLVDFSDAKALFTDEETWAELKEQSLPQVEHVISLEDWQTKHKIITVSRRSADGKPTVKDSVNIVLNQDRTSVSFPQVEPDELSQICFTSGTTGEIKGVMIPYNAHHVGMKSMQHYFPVVSDNKKIALFLPIAHILGLADIVSALGSGCYVYVIQREIIATNLLKVVMLIRPHRMMIIPMVLTKIISTGNICILDQWRKYMKYCVTGGAALPDQVIRKMKDVKFPLTLAYGTTETSLVSLSSPAEYRIGSCGKKIKDVKVCTAPNGEILVKGENVMLGYYKNPEATEAKIDADGWLHTGDKGYLDEDGYLYVEGRLNQDMIILPNGENINPEDIEVKINALPEVKESIVLERDGKLVAIVVSSLIENRESKIDLRRHVLRTINPLLPLYLQLYDVEITDTPLVKTEKQTIKRYLYK